MIARSRRLGAPSPLWRLAVRLLALPLLGACSGETAAPDGWARISRQAVLVGTVPVGQVERQVRRVGACADSVRDLFTADWPAPDSLWVAWRDSLPASPEAPASVRVDGRMLQPAGRQPVVLRSAATPQCDAATAWPPVSWFGGVAWTGGSTTVAASFTWYGGVAEVRDSTFARCRGPARLINGDGASVLAFGGCTFRALPPLITGLASLDPTSPGRRTPQDQLRLVGLARIGGAAVGRDTLLLRVEVLRTEGPLRGIRDTAQMLLSRRAP